MTYYQMLEKVTVLGAAGKMGSGILLLTALEMTDNKLKNKDCNPILIAIDVSDEALSGVLKYIEAQTTKLAAKKIEFLKEYYTNILGISGEDLIIDNYVKDVLSIIHPSTDINHAVNSKIIFEAINENPDLKVSIFKKIDSLSADKPWYFTNTSSVPIGFLDSSVELNGRIIGFHFYNPPAVQKLVEIISADSTKSEIKDFAVQYAKNLKKVVVHSNDKAGFIGNGHFMRDSLYALHEVERLNAHFTLTEAIYIINKISQDYLIRPMGIFQLIDYVGVDVVTYIMGVMNPYFTDEELSSPLLKKFLENGIKGGQYSDGTQRNGILKYEKGLPMGIYDFDQNEYVPIERIVTKCDEAIGQAPSSLPKWKDVVKSENKETLLREYFNELEEMESLAAVLAKKYANNSRLISLKLVDSKVALSYEDVNTVLITGFFHAYGPINNYINWQKI